MTAPLGSASDRKGPAEPLKYPLALFEPGCFSHALGPRAAIVETHISWVFLAGDYAYKVKKPVRLPFVDFSTLDARHHFCEEELRLNRRTAPELYLDVVPIGGSPAQPQMGMQERAFEYAVRMRRFPQEALARNMAIHGSLTRERIDALASSVAMFHGEIAPEPESSGFGDGSNVAATALENFAEMGALALSPGNLLRLGRLREWTVAEAVRLAAVFVERKHSGFVRECHGDLHLGNIVFIAERALPFDCIEFNAELRWIDVVNDAAFTLMDLHKLAGKTAAQRFVNAYLECTGDYRGLLPLRFYLVYRALVRSKVELILGGQAKVSSGSQVISGNEAEASSYLRLAEDLSQWHAPLLVIMHGLAGSGKTTVAGVLTELSDAIRVRSDIERKRLHGLDARARTRAAPYSGIYVPGSSRATYDRLKVIVHDIVASGRTAIVDAAFLCRDFREEFRALAYKLKIPFLLVSCRAAEGTLRHRIARRENEMKDASEAGLEVLASQLATQDLLAPDELGSALVVDTEADEKTLMVQLKTIGGRI